MFKTRLLDIIKHLNSNPTKFGKDLGYSSSEKIRRLTKDENAYPSFQILRDICVAHPQINAKWLLTGDGEMLLTETNKYLVPEAQYKICPLCNEKDEQNKALKKLINTQEEFIEHLKKNK